MPNRVLRDCSDSTAFENISLEAESLFFRLLMKVDDFGRFHADPRMIKGVCYPLSESVNLSTISVALSELSKREIIVIYKSNGRDYLAIRKFRQRTRAMKSKFPQPDGEAPDWEPSDEKSTKTCYPTNDGHMTVSCPSTAHVVRSTETETETNTRVVVRSREPAQPADNNNNNESDSDWLGRMIVSFPGIDVEEELRKLYKKNGSRTTSRIQAEAWLRRASPKAPQLEQPKSRWSF